MQNSNLIIGVHFPIPPTLRNRMRAPRIWQPPAPRAAPPRAPTSAEMGCATDAQLYNCTAEECQSCAETCTSVCSAPQALRGFVERCCDCSAACGMSVPHMWVAMGIMLATLVLLSKRRWGLFPVGRSMGAGICAIVVVASGCLPVDALNDPGIMDMNTIATLFGLTIVTGYLDDFGVVDACIYLMQRRCGSGRQLMFRITMLTTILSACVTNDAAVIILTSPVLQVCTQMKIDPMPFLVALATTANVGSALTLIGNPQNILIAAASGISFFNFTALMAPAVAAGLGANILLLCIWYHPQLRSGGFGSIVTGAPGSDDTNDEKAAQASMPRMSMLGTTRRRRATVSSVVRSAPSDSGGIHSGLLSNQEINRQPASDRRTNPPASRPVSPGQRQAHAEASESNEDSDELATALPEPHFTCCGRQVKWQTVERVFGSIACASILAGFVVSTSIAWTALGGVAAMALIEVYIRGGDGTDVLRHVDGFLLVMIAGLFIIIAGARRTGVPDSLFQRFGEISGATGCHSDNVGGPAAFECFDLDFDSVTDVLAFGTVVLVLSNLCSNVPTVMLLAHSLEKLPLSRKDAVVGWLTLSWAATVAGNFTLVGSIANLIVAEKAHQGGVELGFVTHFKFCSWTTLLIAAGGCCMIFFVARPMIALLDP